MSLLHDRTTPPEYGLVLALICMALALIVAKYSRQQPSVQFPSVVSGARRANKADYFVCRCRRRNAGLVVEER
jgi:hypothetical protein